MYSWSSWLRQGGESETEWGLPHLIAFVLLTLTPRIKQNARPDTEPEYYATTKHQIQRCRVKIHYGRFKTTVKKIDLSKKIIIFIFCQKLLTILTDLRGWLLFPFLFHDNKFLFVQFCVEVGEIKPYSGYIMVNNIENINKGFHKSKYLFLFHIPFKEKLNI